MKALIWTLSMAVIGIIGCAPPAQDAPPGPDPVADEAAIRALVANYDAAFGTGDHAALMAIYAADVVQMPPEDAIVLGKDALSASFEEFLGTGGGTLTTTVEDLRVSGDLAYCRTTYEFEATNPETGDAVSEAGNWVLNYERQEDGSWAIVSEIWNTPPGEDEGTDSDSDSEEE